jgi:hypothetical protein
VIGQEATMGHALAHADLLLKALGRPADVPSLPLVRTALVALLAAAAYGAFMGSFSLHSPERAWLMVYSAAKMPILIAATGALCLPGFFVLNSILGLRGDLPRALGAILASQAALAVALLSLGPLTRLAYFSGIDHREAILVNAGMFAAATVAGHTVMLRRYRPLIADNPLHRFALWAWVVLYVFVGIQMGWMLRPFIGSPAIPVTFLREEPFSNAYVFLVRLIFS